VAGGRLYTPLQCLGVHYIQLGYFSREFSHVNAARARTFAPHTDGQVPMCVCVCDHVHAHSDPRRSRKVAGGAAGISLGNFVRHRGISFWELLIFEGNHPPYPRRGCAIKKINDAMRIGERELQPASLSGNLGTYRCSARAAVSRDVIRAHQVFRVRVLAAGIDR